MDRGRRYKERGLQFASAEDSRALRAVESQAGRKARRDSLLGRRRIYGLDECTDRKETNVHRKLAVADVQPEMITKKSEKDLALQRYQNLLKWREERQKKLDKEKRKRKPSFKTGLYQPDQPKFLISDGVEVTESKECTPAKPTPFKYLQRSSTKYGFTPGTSVHRVPRFCTGVTPAATMSNIPKFTLRTTPTSSGGRAGILSRKHPGQKENFLGPSCARRNTDVKSQARMKSKASCEGEMKRILRGRGNRSLKPALENEDLGVKVLPRTPKACQHTLMDCEKAKSALPSLGSSSSSSSLGYSFAPDDFSFTFKKNAGCREPRSEDVEKLQEQFNADCSFSEEEKIDAKAQKCGDSRAPETSSKGNDEDLFKTVSGDASSSLELSRREEQVCVSASKKTSRKNKTLNFNDPEAKTLLTGSNDLVDMKVLIETEDKLKSTDITEDKLEGDLKKKEITNLEFEEETASMTAKVESVKDSDADYCSPAYKTRLRDEEKPKSPKIDFEIVNAEKVTDPSLPEVKYSVSKGQETPLPLRRRSTRNSKRLSSCADTILTPFMTRLRPRTPCSRSTRRSLSAHCDLNFEVMSTPSKPSSTRRRSRHPGSIALNASDIKEPTVPLKLGEEISKSLAQEFSGGIDKTSFLMNENNVIEEDREDQVVTSEVGECKKDEHTDIAEPEPLKEDFMVQSPKQADTVTPCGSRRRGKVSWMVHNSPYINTEKRSNSRRSEVPADMKGLFDDIPTDGSPLPAHLIPLLAEGRKIQQAISPIQPTVEANSSGIESGQSSAEEQICTNLLALLELSAPTERTDSPDFDVWSEESPYKVNDSIQTEPVPSKDAVHLPTPVTRRKSSRISLLPGMSNSPVAADKLSIISEDLISWETPVTSARKRSKEHLVTPCRRSQRLSKAYPQ